MSQAVCQLAYMHLQPWLGQIMKFSAPELTACTHLQDCHPLAFRRGSRGTGCPDTRQSAVAMQQADHSVIPVSPPASHWQAEQVCLFHAVQMRPVPLQRAPPPPPARMAHINQAPSTKAWSSHLTAPAHGSAPHSCMTLQMGGLTFKRGAPRGLPSPTPHIEGTAVGRSRKTWWRACCLSPTTGSLWTGLR